MHAGPPCGLTPIAEIFKHHIIDLGSEKISQRQSRFIRYRFPSTAHTSYHTIHHMHRMSSSSSSSAAGAADKESSDDPQFIKVSLIYRHIHT